MTPAEEFEHLFMCTHEPDPRLVELEKRLLQYYKAAEFLDRRESSKLSREFNFWAKNYYTQEEISSVKHYVNRFEFIAKCAKDHGNVPDTNFCVLQGQHYMTKVDVWGLLLDELSDNILDNV